MNKHIRWLVIGDGILLLYSFLYAYIFHFDAMLKIRFYGFLTPLYVATSFGILGIIFIYSGITGRINTIARVLAGITSVILIVMLSIHGIPLLLTQGILAPLVLQGFAFAGGLLFHIIFQCVWGGGLGLTLAVKPSLLLKVEKGIRN